MASIAATALMVAPAMAQQPPAAGRFDGKYGGKMTCFPAIGQAQVRGLAIKASKFMFDFTFNDSHRVCPVQIKPDGTFDNQKCDVPLSGKIEGKNLSIHLRTQDAICDITAAREI